MDTKKYTLDELEKLWTEYHARFVYRYLTAGKWKISETKPRGDTILKVEYHRYNDIVSFPKFLRIKNG